jgi:NADH-quinone oxidoreductase subunit J
VVVVLGVIATVVLTARGIGDASLRDGITSTQDLSRVLFHELLLPFEVTSILILIAILGAVALARHGHGDPEQAPRKITDRKEIERMAAK